MRFGKEAEVGGIEHAERQAQAGEHQRRAGERERDREADQDQAAQAQEHGEVEHLAERAHKPASPVSSASPRLASMPASSSAEWRGERQALERQQAGEHEDHGLQQIDAGDAEAALGRALADRPGGRHVGPGDPGDQRAHRQQEHDHPEQVDQRLGPRRGGAVEDVAADVAVVQQRVAGRDHEQARVHVDDQFLHLDRAQAEDVAQHDHGELQQHDQQREPGDRAPERLVGAVDRARERLEQPHPASPGLGHGGGARSRPPSRRRRPRSGRSRDPADKAGLSRTGTAAPGRSGSPGRRSPTSRPPCCGSPCSCRRP